MIDGDHYRNSMNEAVKLQITLGINSYVTMCYCGKKKLTLKFTTASLTWETPFTVMCVTAPNIWFFILYSLYFEAGEA